MSLVIGSVGRAACVAQNPHGPSARELGAAATTRSASPPVEATAIRAPRASLLGVALRPVGWVARGAPCRSPPNRDSLAPSRLPRFLDLDVTTTGHLRACRTRAYHGPRESALGLATHSRRVAQAGIRSLAAHRCPSHAAPPEVTLQTWRTFLKNHLADLVSVDFFVVPTATFRMLYVFVVLLHHRRRVVHFNVTDSTTAAWTAQQIVEAFPDDSAPRYLLRDRDGIYGGEFQRRAKGRGLTEVLTAPSSPWQNPFAERVIGTIRRELLDHVIVLNEAHLRRRLRSYLRYYHGSRTHLSLAKDAPESRAVEQPELGRIVALPQVGGLHHRYTRCAA